MSCFPSRRSDALVITLLVVIACASATAFAHLTAYKSVPGRGATAPERWPAESSLPRTAGLPTLVMFVHPMCPCTAASLRELRTALSHFEGKVTPIVAMAELEGASADWREGRNREIAESIRSLAVIADDDEREAKRFGAHTSGQVVLYGANDELLFSGGITGARGHEGDNPGRARVVALLENPDAARDGTPVFGCELSEETGAP